MIEMISQIAIFTLGALSIILIAKKNRWGFVLGLASQPFWILTSFMNQQWGVFFLSLIYTGSWILGIYEWFFKNSSSNSNKLG